LWVEVKWEKERGEEKEKKKKREKKQWFHVMMNNFLFVNRKYN